MTLSSRPPEKNKKIISRWYRCLDRPNSIFISVPDTCWRYIIDRYYLYIWWSCPYCMHFGYQCSISNILWALSLTEQPSVRITLILLLPGAISLTKKDFFLSWLLNVLYTTIGNEALSFLGWICLIQYVDDIMSMEELVALSYDCCDSFSSTWFNWLMLHRPSQLQGWLTTP